MTVPLILAQNFWDPTSESAFTRILLTNQLLVFLGKYLPDIGLVLASIAETYYLLDDQKNAHETRMIIDTLVEGGESGKDGCYRWIRDLLKNVGILINILVALKKNWQEIYFCLFVLSQIY